MGDAGDGGVEKKAQGRLHHGRRHIDALFVSSTLSLRAILLPILHPSRLRLTHDNSAHLTSEWPAAPFSPLILFIVHLFARPYGDTSTAPAPRWSFRAI